MAEIFIEKKKGNKWLLPLIGLVLLVVLASWYAKRDDNRESAPSAMNDTTRTTTRDAAR